MFLSGKRYGGYEMEMPKVSECSVSECAYNENSICHAIAITVGDKSDESKCDTFIQSDIHGGFEETIAGVGACKASDCQFNERFECVSPSIQVGFEGGTSHCLTFKTG